MGKESGKQLMETLWLDSDVKFIKDFNEAILNMFKELKHTLFKDLKENMMVITQRRGIINKEINWLTRTKQILKLKSTINKMKNS